MLRNHLARLFTMLAAISCTNLYAASCEFSVASEWNTGFTSSVSITNNTDLVIDGWTASIEFTNGTTISNMWNARLSGSNPYQAADSGYNGTIQPNSTTSFGFNSQKLLAGTPVQSPVLGGICDSDATNLPPTAKAVASPSEGVVPLTVNFDGSLSTDPDDDGLNYEWLFTDGTTSSDISTSRTYSVPGTYSVALTVNDGSSNSGVTYVTVTAKAAEPENAQCEYILRDEWNTGFTSAIKVSNPSDQAINGWSVSIDFSDDATIGYFWNADIVGGSPYVATNKHYNGTIWPNSSIEFGFNSLKSNTNGVAMPPILGGICSATNVNRPPVANASASPLSGTAPLTVDFDASSSSDPDGDELIYFWNFGGGDTSSEFFTSRTFTEAGSYIVSLTVIDDSYVSDATEVTITVSDPPPVDSYVLDQASSSLHFVSTKKVHVVETHTFNVLSGEISADGVARMWIDLNSVDTSIDIRNERMRNVLFETATYSQAEISLSVDTTDLSTLAVGSSILQTVIPVLNLHGISVPIEAHVRTTKVRDDTILVQNTSPILVRASDFDLVNGIEALRTLASLSVISYTVPTNFTLFFTKQ
jgi:PKD repeat protein